MEFLSGESLKQSKEERSSKIAIWFIVGLTLIRLVYHAFRPIELMGDESYYWDWSRHLDWGYYSKPPMIAWLYGLGSFLGGGVGYTFIFKGMAVLISSARLGFIFLATRRLLGAQVAMWATLLVGSSVADFALSSLLTPDNPMLLGWFAAFYATVRLSDKKGANGKSAKWLYLLMFMALGFGLLSKQMVFVLMGLILIWAMIGARHLLKKRLFYLSVVGANVWLIPSWWWNANNGNATSDHTAHHFEPAKMGFEAIFSRFAEFIGQELLIIGLVTFPVILFLCVRYFREFRRLEKNEKMVLTFCVPVLLIMMAMMVRQRVNANWPAAFLLMGAIGASAVLVRSKPGWLKGTIITNVFFVVVAMVLAPTYLIPVQQRDWKAWRFMAASLIEQAEAHDYNEDSDFMLTCYKRYYTSQLSFYMKGQPQFYYWPGSFDAFGVADKIQHQYSFWAGPETTEKSRAFIFVPSNKPLPKSLEEAFSSVDKIGMETFTWKSIFSEEPAKVIRQVDLYIGVGYKGWPESKFTP